MEGQYYFLGDNVGLAKVHGTQSYICVDTRSWESMIFITGGAVEPDEVEAFKRFLSPADVVLDIGANFGLYSLIAGDVVRDNGRLFSFEASPHTFQFLKRTALVNRLFWSGRNSFVNAAVSDAPGEASFVSYMNSLGGSHIQNASQDLPEATVVDRVKQISIDDFLDKDLKVDLVKIDVEGNELNVLKGMQEVIKRSPSIRIILEYYTNSAEPTEQGKAVLDFIWSIGLTACSIGGKGILTEIPKGKYPTGNLYLFLTKTPQQDVVRTSNLIALKMRGFQYHNVYRGPSALLHGDGTFKFEKSHHLETTEPTLFFGPYIPLQRGRYQLRAKAESTGPAHITFAHDLGNTIVAQFIIDDWKSPIEFTLDIDISDLEIIVRRTPDLERLQISEMELARI
ncbi:MULTISPECIES: FkbM family methyltransferase [unclassified Beijerinckia]|uniref:FkbM family methyltransferase n=1 Tax=unclassified Beijerinckia TaxID=2638183 RepID=UPI00089785AE|nr:MULTISPECIES: FkbM family methyltransferase [unclassified Beijerinckia]MDH7796150.1 FkbM family methyltransferase [Beijerinckia sp. GAS462]SEC32553.1 methyltransferase, FkbM family [Beijerinckia sp. 28-YEA-48]